MAVIPLFRRQQVIQLYIEGVSGRNIARQVNISLGAVQKIIKKYRSGFGVENKPKSGRPRLLTARMSNRIAICSKRDPTRTAREVMTDCNLHGVVSIDTVKRELRRCGLFGRIAVKKPMLSRSNIKKRFQWCVAKRDWTVNNWKSIIFSDECRLELNPNKRVYVRRHPGVRIQPKCINYTTKFSHNIMVWGAIRGDGRRILIRCEGNVDSQEYQRILSVALPSIYTSRHRFQHDGAASHRSASTTRFLDQKAIRQLDDWPPQSPDLNIIEHLWDLLKFRVNVSKLKSLIDLWEVALHEWNSIPNETILKLYDSAPRRVKAVLSNKGRNTPY